MKDEKRFVVYYDEGILNGPSTNIFNGDDWLLEDEWSFEEDFIEELRNLKIGDSRITPDSGVTYTVRVWRVE
ncbi:MAG: hypothetical protein ACTSW1_02010 [Candidatus Hodarchaeales archaeon]